MSEVIVIPECNKKRTESYHLEQEAIYITNE